MFFEPPFRIKLQKKKRIEPPSDRLSFKAHEKTISKVKQILDAHPEKIRELEDFRSIKLKKREIRQENSIVLFLKKDKRGKDKVRVLHKMPKGKAKPIGSGGHKSWYKTGRLETKDAEFKDYIFSQFHAFNEGQDEAISNIKRVNEISSPHLSKAYVLDKGSKKEFRYQLFQKYEENGNLEHFYGSVESGKKSLFPTFLSKIDAMISLCKGLYDMHKANIIHDDISTGNVFISKDGKLRLGDYDTARQEDASTLPSKGTALFFSPEKVWREEGKASDVWALGIIFFMINEDGLLPSYLKACMPRKRDCVDLAFLHQLTKLEKEDIQLQYGDIPSREKNGWQEKRFHLNKKLLGQELAEREFKELVFDMHQLSVSLRPRMGEIIARLNKIKETLALSDQELETSSIETSISIGNSSTESTDSFRKRPFLAKKKRTFETNLKTQKFINQLNENFRPQKEVRESLVPINLISKGIQKKSAIPNRVGIQKLPFLNEKEKMSQMVSGKQRGEVKKWLQNTRPQLCAMNKKRKMKRKPLPLQESVLRNE